MRFFRRKGNYVRIDDSDLSNKIDKIKNEFIKNKYQQKYNRKKFIKNILKLSFWGLFLVLIILLIKSYFFKDNLKKGKNSMDNNDSKTNININTNKKDSINLNYTQKNQTIYNNMRRVGNLTNNTKRFKIIESIIINNKNEFISLNKKRRNVDKKIS